MKIKKEYIVKGIKKLIDTSAFQQVKEYHIKGDAPLKPFPTLADRPP